VNLDQSDPLGKDQHEKGAKLDKGKIRLGMVLGGFARALKAVGEVGTFGANKYTDNGWMEVPDGIARYTDALFRHLNAECLGEAYDSESSLLIAAHSAWNSLARLDLMIREKEDFEHYGPAEPLRPAKIETQDLTRQIGRCGQKDHSPCCTCGGEHLE
jgi:hypothetical protein